MRVVGLIVGANEARKGTVATDNPAMWFAIICVAGADTVQGWGYRLIDRLFGNGSRN